MKPVELSKPRKGRQALKDIGWKSARELINNAYFGYHKKNGRKNTKWSCNIRILFNGTYNDRSKVRQQLSKELRNTDNRNQVWVALLQTCANATKVGYIFYMEDEGITLEIAVKKEAAFESTNDCIKWYNMNDN
eukprot:9170338-Ditylum_brightwellii.AAC.1